MIICNEGQLVLVMTRTLYWAGTCTGLDDNKIQLTRAFMIPEINGLADSLAGEVVVDAEPVPSVTIDLSGAAILDASNMRFKVEMKAVKPTQGSKKGK